MIAINGKEIQTDAEGYLANLEDWSEEVAEVL
jgi:sulfur relay (sulfurtransferase) DsrC/TusE family protein